MSIEPDALMLLITTNLRDAIEDGRARCDSTFWFSRPYQGGNGSAVIVIGQTKIKIETTDRELIGTLEAAEVRKLEAEERQFNGSANDATREPDDEDTCQQCDQPYGAHRLADLVCPPPYDTPKTEDPGDWWDLGPGSTFDS